MPTINTLPADGGAQLDQGDLEAAHGVDREGRRVEPVGDRVKVGG